MNTNVPPTDTLVVGIGSGMYPEKGAIQFRVSAVVAGDLIDSLRAAGITVGPVPQNSTVPWDDLIKFAAVTGGSLGGLAAVLSAFFGRHQHRSIVLTHRGGTFEMHGMSPDETRDLIDRVVGESAAAQEENDKLWGELMEGKDEPEDEPQ